MIYNRKIITICGSTKFKDEIIKQQKRLTLEGNVVLSPFIFSHSGDEDLVNDDNLPMLMDIHLCKILLSDEIFVVNVNNYIGDGLKYEINEAKKMGKKITYLE